MALSQHWILRPRPYTLSGPASPARTGSCTCGGRPLGAMATPCSSCCPPESLQLVPGSPGVGHFRVTTTLHRVQSCFYWPGCCQDVELYIHRANGARWGERTLGAQVWVFCPENEKVVSPKLLVLLLLPQAPEAPLGCSPQHLWDFVLTAWVWDH